MTPSECGYALGFCASVMSVPWVAMGLARSMRSTQRQPARPAGAPSTAALISVSRLPSNSALPTFARCDSTLHEVQNAGGRTGSGRACGVTKKPDEPAGCCRVSASQGLSIAVHMGGMGPADTSGRRVVTRRKTVLRHTTASDRDTYLLQPST